MKITLKLTLLTIALTTWATTVRAAYVETMDPKDPAGHFKSDYGLMDDNAKTNQSDIFQMKGIISFALRM